MDTLKAGEAVGVVTIQVTELPSSYQRLRLMFGTRQRLRTAIGCHPLRAEQFTLVERSLFSRLVGDADYIGEVGLDGSQHGRATLATQRRVLDFVLGHPGCRSKVLTVHSRGAEEETIAKLRDAGATAILHWYTGALKHIPVALDAGMWFSVNPAMARSARGRRIMSEIPRERILTETDGPFATADGRPCRPSDIPRLVADLAAMWDEPTEVAREQIWANMAMLVAHAGSK